MTLAEAKSAGWTSLFKGTLIVVCILVALLLIGETRGDFANGILFFLAATVNVNSLIIMAILFGLTYLFSGPAVTEILVKKKNTLLVTIKYVALISFAICIYASTIAFLRMNDFSYNGMEKILKSFSVGLFFKAGLFLCIIWLWSTNKIKSIIIT